MSLRVVGAGLGRTGTASLKRALEVLLGGRCYHMFEAAARPGDATVWQRAVRGEAVDWDALFEDFVATVDWPACSFWRELRERHPDALVLLSERESPQRWWASMERTIVPTLKSPVPADDVALARHRKMVIELISRCFTPRWDDGDAAIAAYERHNAEVRESVPRERLVEWRPGDGWDPLCEALAVEVPDEPFPHENTTAHFRERQGLDG
jgi:hypothetical protein